MRKHVLTVALLVSALALRAAQTQFPDTPAAREFSVWLTAFDSGDREAIQHFLDSDYSGDTCNEKLSVR